MWGHPICIFPGKSKSCCLPYVPLYLFHLIRILVGLVRKKCIPKKRKHAIPFFRILPPQPCHRIALPTEPRRHRRPRARSRISGPRFHQQPGDAAKFHCLEVQRATSHLKDLWDHVDYKPYIYMYIWYIYMHKPYRFHYICDIIHANFIPYGGFHKWCYHHSWMVYNEKTQSKMDDLRAPPFIETFILFQIYTHTYI